MDEARNWVNIYVYREEEKGFLEGTWVWFANGWQHKNKRLIAGRFWFFEVAIAPSLSQKFVKGMLVISQSLMFLTWPTD